MHKESKFQCAIKTLKLEGNGLVIFSTRCCLEIECFVVFTQPTTCFLLVLYPLLLLTVSYHPLPLLCLVSYFLLLKTAGSDTTGEDANTIQKEINILKLCKHDNIVRYYGCCVLQESIWVFQPGCTQTRQCHLWVHTDTQPALTHVLIHSCIHTYTQRLPHVHTHTHAPTYTLTSNHILSLTRICTRTRTHTHTDIVMTCSRF